MKGKLLFGLVGGLAAVVIAGLAFTGGANAQTFGLCAYGPGDHVACTYNSPYGIQSVFITNLAPGGSHIVLWNEAYDCESPVQFSYDSVGPDGIFEVEECDPPVGVGGGDNGSFTSEAGPTVLPGTGKLDLTSEGQTTDAQGIYSACYVDYRNCDLASYECEHLGQGCPPPSSPSGNQTPTKLKIAR
jgi:hypothetical protein